jgi:probable F420-dependent oxidoreductase
MIRRQRVRFGVMYNPTVQGVDPQRLVAHARLAEECGFEGFYLPEHLALHPGAKIGDFELPMDLPFLDPLDSLAFVAAATERILLGTAVLLLPYQHPVVLAKRLATLDVLSGGRMRLFTTGVGALPGEAAAVGVDYPSRGRRANEAIDVLRLLWTGGVEGVSFSGEFFDLTDLCLRPTPVGGAALPVHVGGSGRAAARRAGRRGDGWFPGGGLTPHDRAALWALVRETARAAGRDPDAIEQTRWGSVGMTPAQAEQLAEEGVTRVVVSATTTDPAEQRDQLGALAERFGLG